MKPGGVQARAFERWSLVRPVGISSLVAKASSMALIRAPFLALAIELAHCLPRTSWAILMILALGICFQYLFGRGSELFGEVDL